MHVFYHVRDITIHWSKICVFCRFCKPKYRLKLSEAVFRWDIICFLNEFLRYPGVGGELRDRSIANHVLYLREIKDDLNLPLLAHL